MYRKTGEYLTDISIFLKEYYIIVQLYRRRKFWGGRFILVFLGWGEENIFITIPVVTSFQKITNIGNVHACMCIHFLPPCDFFMLGTGHFF